MTDFVYDLAIAPLLHSLKQFDNLVTKAYNILRHSGVPLGKRDYLGGA